MDKAIKRLMENVIQEEVFFGGIAIKNIFLDKLLVSTEGKNKRTTTTLKFQSN